MASGSSTREEPPASPVVANAPPLLSTEAKMILATGRDNCQQLKDMVRKEDPSTMVVVMSSSHQTSTPPKPPSERPLMDPGLLAVASSGSWKKLQAFLNGDPLPTSGDERIKCCCCSWRKRQSSPPAKPRPTSNDGTIGSSAIQPPTSDIEAHLREAILDGVTFEGDTFLHVMATNSVDDDLMEDELGLIRSKAEKFLFEQNNNEDTPLHCAVRGDKPQMVSFLLDLARGNNADTVKALLETGNSRGWTVLHEAVRVGNNNMVKSLMTEDSELARFPNDMVKLPMTEESELASCPKDGLPKDATSPLYLAILLERKTIAETLHEMSGGQLSYSGPNGQNALHAAVLRGKDGLPKDATSPLYLAILLERKTIAETLHEMSGGELSYSGPNGQNVLHAAVLRGKDLTEMLLGWNHALTIQQDENGSTPLHLAASIHLRTIHLLLLEANPDALYQPDNDGLFPTHVAASIDATLAINDFLKKSPSCAGLRDARGRTFLHIAVDKRKLRTVRSTCKNKSLSWILNMQDNDGNSALHLAVQKGSLRMFCALFGNSKVQLNLTNEKGETPKDIARRNLPKRGLYYNQNSEAKIHVALKTSRAKWGIYRQDYFEKNDIVQARQDEIHDMEILKDSTQNLCIGSVLIATVTFGATFAMPGGYRADDHTNGGTPTLAGRYAFDAFIIANALAFAFSTMATIGLMSSGSPLYNIRSRVMHLLVAFYFMKISVTMLVAAFSLGTYMMLAPVAHKVAVAVCVLSSLVLLYSNFEVAIKHTRVILARCRRAGMCNNIVVIFPLSALSFVGTILFQLWPFLVIFGSAALNYAGHKVQPPRTLA